MNVETLIIGTAVVLTIILTPTMFGLFKLVRGHQLPAVRIAAAVSAVVVLLFSPGVFDMAMMRHNRTAGLTYIAIDPSWFIKLAPAVVAVVVAAILVGRMPSRGGSQMGNR